MMGSGNVADKSLSDLLAVAADPERARAFLEQRARMLQLNRQSAQDARKATAEADKARAAAEEANDRLVAHSKALATSMDQLQAGVAKLEKDRATHEEAKAKDALVTKAERESFAAHVQAKDSEHTAREADLKRREDEVAQAARALDARAAAVKKDEEALAARKADLALRFAKFRELMG